MNERQYGALLAILIVPPLVAEIAKRSGKSEMDAIDRLYNSRLYEQLSDERLKLWHYSPVMLCDMLEEELSTGTITYPEEAG